MFAVGALDAYFCDAYTDVVAATIISKNRCPAMAIPDFFQKIKFPVRAFLEQYSVNENWKWRMAAREMMAKENVLSLEEIQSLFKRFLRPQHRFFQDVLEAWITHPNAMRRVFGITQADYLATPAADKDGRMGTHGNVWRIATRQSSSDVTIAFTIAIGHDVRLNR